MDMVENALFPKMFTCKHFLHLFYLIWVWQNGFYDRTVHMQAYAYAVLMNIVENRIKNFLQLQTLFLFVISIYFCSC